MFGDPDWWIPASLGGAWGLLLGVLRYRLVRYLLTQDAAVVRFSSGGIWKGMEILAATGYFAIGAIAAFFLLGQSSFLDLQSFWLAFLFAFPLTRAFFVRVEGRLEERQIEFDRGSSHQDRHNV